MLKLQMPQLKSLLKPKVFLVTPSQLFRLFQLDSLKMKDKNLNVVCYKTLQLRRIKFTRIF